MDFVEEIRVSKERAETGFGAEIDRAAAILGAREVSRIGIAEDAPAEGDKTRMFLLLCRILRHLKIFLQTSPPGTAA